MYILEQVVCHFSDRVRVTLSSDLICFLLQKTKNSHNYSAHKFEMIVYTLNRFQQIFQLCTVSCVTRKYIKSFTKIIFCIILSRNQKVQLHYNLNFLFVICGWVLSLTKSLVFFVYQKRCSHNCIFQYQRELFPCHASLICCNSVKFQIVSVKWFQ